MPTKLVIFMAKEAKDSGLFTEGMIRKIIHIGWVIRLQNWTSTLIHPAIVSF